MATSVARKSLPASLTNGVKRQVVDRTAKVIYASFPQASKAEQVSRRFFAIFVTLVGGLGFLALLGINTLLAQDAFTLSNLKVEVKMVADERDAINRTIDAYSAPDALAQAATTLGMKPSETPIFLNLDSPSEVTRG